MKLFSGIINKWNRRSGSSYLDMLRSKGVKVGKGTILKYPANATIDYSRPELLEIGENVLLHKGITILTHDYASRVMVNRDGLFYPSHGKIVIGNNVWFGEKCTVMKGVTIGDNCIIGYGSVVMKDIPAGSVAAGSPAKVLCTLDQYVEKRSRRYVDEAVEYANAIIDSGRVPVVMDFKDDYPCFVDGENYQDYDFPYSKVFTTSAKFEEWKKNHKKVFNGFEDFITHVYSTRK